MINKNMGISGNMKDVKKVIKVDRIGGGPVQIPGGPIRCFRAPCPGGIPLPSPTRPRNPRQKTPAPNTNPRNAKKLKNIFG